MEVKRNTITLPIGLFEKVMALAEKEERSFNKQVITLLKAAIENQEPKTRKGESHGKLNQRN